MVDEKENHNVVDIDQTSRINPRSHVAEGKGESKPRALHGTNDKRKGRKKRPLEKLIYQNNRGKRESDFKEE